MPTEVWASKVSAVSSGTYCQVKVGGQYGPQSKTMYSFLLLSRERELCEILAQRNYACAHPKFELVTLGSPMFPLFKCNSHMKELQTTRTHTTRACAHTRAHAHTHTHTHTHTHKRTINDLIIVTSICSFSQACFCHNQIIITDL